MTPDALRAAIASARLRPRMYAQTGEHLASMLYGMVAGAAPDGVDVGPAWGDAYSPANVHAPTDAEVCDAAEATVSALWPQGDAPAGDECAAYSAAPLDTPMPPAFVAALAALSPAPLDLPDGDECFRTGDDAGRLRNLLAVIHRDGGHHTEAVGIAQACCDAAARVLAAYHAGDAPARRAAEAGALTTADVLRLADSIGHGELDAEAVGLLVARVRELEAEADEYDALIQRQGALLLATADALKGPPPPLSQHSAHDLPEVAAALVAQLAAQAPAVALEAIRRGSAAMLCCVCSAEWPLDVRDCPGCGHPDRAAGAVPDTDLCAKCGGLDLDGGHVCPKSAATVAGEAFAAERPEAAGRILG